MEEGKYTKLVQAWVLAGAILLFLLIVTAWIIETSNKEWRKQQRAFIRELETITGDSQAGKELERGIFQVDLPQFGRSDRCISCHFGIEDPRMHSAAQPHTLHPGSLLKDHPVEDFGCTMCHGGQPRALGRKEAHGRVQEAHWPYPMLEEPYIQSSCGKCHLSIFSTGEALNAQIENMDVFLRGKEIFSREGCLGCHQARGVGGILGPDLTEQGEKSRHEYSFQHISGEQSVSHWLKEHFRDPEMVSPGSQMLKIDLDEEELAALATFVMGLARPEMPFEYFSMDALQEFKGIRDTIPGRPAFAYLCSACHGKQGEGKSWLEYKTGIPAIGNADFLRVASKDFIHYTVEKGRSRKQMASWNGQISGMKAAELDDLVRWLDEFESLPSAEQILRIKGSADAGKELFASHCQTCHGNGGAGGVALALKQQDLLQKADNTYLLATLLRGRGNTAMPAWTNLEHEALADLIAYMDSWREGRVSYSGIRLPEGNPDEGALRYHFLCSRCHGEFGEGETGPSIINADFLEAAGDPFLYLTIAEGRAHTAMFGWSSDVYNQEQLKKHDISNLIAFMRRESKAELSYIFPGRNPGDHRAGADLYKTHCSECHGLSGEGKAAPALNNQEMLSAASNGYLMATITVGRMETPMPAWGYPRGKWTVLSQKEREDLVAFIRNWQRIRIKY